MRFSNALWLIVFALGVVAANADIILYSSTFDGAGGSALNGTAVTTSGATAAQHAQYGTTNGATWSAHTKFEADGSTPFSPPSGPVQRLFQGPPAEQPPFPRPPDRPNGCFRGLPPKANS